MTTDTEARELVERLKTREPYKSALQIACEENISQAGEQTVGEMRVFLGQGDYPTLQHLADVMTRDANQAADTITALLAENERLRRRLHRIAQPGRTIAYCQNGHEEAVLIARAALKGADDD